MQRVLIKNLLHCILSPWQQFHSRLNFGSASITARATMDTGSNIKRSLVNYSYFMYKLVLFKLMFMKRHECNNVKYTQSSDR